MTNKNQGFLPLAVPLNAWIVGLVLLLGPFFIFGVGAFIKFWDIMSTPVVKGSIPIWSIFVVGLIIIIYLRGR